MKAHLTKVSLALLSTVFLLGCQEQGSGAVGPDGLVPQFNKPDANGNHNHGAEEDDGPPYNISLSGDIFSLDSKRTSCCVKDAHILIVEGISMNLAFFNGDNDDPNNPNKLSCELKSSGSTVFEGTFQISEGSSDPPICTPVSCSSTTGPPTT